LVGIDIPTGDFLHRLATVADVQTLARFRSTLEVERKVTPGFKFDPVTNADRAAELALRALISTEYPAHAISGEEFGDVGDGPVRWVLDPIDGTRPFICGIPVWSTLIGLMIDGRAEMGMLSQPFIGERFWADMSGAWYQKGAERRALRTSAVGELSDAILHTTAPESFSKMSRTAFEVLANTVKMTRYGGESYACAMLAAGLIDLCVEPSLQPYDIVAIIPIIEKAGGVVATLDGGRAESGGYVVMSSTPALHQQALRLLNQG
jgi:histidinol phosphatase-like enzyme (inositol monophosphatase family)